MLLALDIGSKTGFAAHSVGGITSGTQAFVNDRFSGGGMRFLKFEKWLDTMVRPEQVIFEEVRRHAGTDAAHVYGGLVAVLTKFCEHHKIPYAAVPVGTIKKFWTGKGNASKNMMIGEAKKRGFNPEDDNEADALALLHYWLEEGILTD